MTDLESLIFFLSLPAVAFLYASVGHGGASGYLALMALFNFAPENMRSTALILNILVSFVSFYHFHRKGHMRWNLFFWLIATSVPFAFFGGYVQLETDVYRVILGVFLIFAALKISGLINIKDKEQVKFNAIFALIMGAAIGLASGLIGIGGGILLSPLLLLMGWSNFRETAAISALFITLNSISGLLGNSIRGIEWNVHFTLMIALAFAGGLAGAFYGSSKFSVISLNRILSAALIIASIKLIFS